MKATNRQLAIAWGALYGLCAIFSLIPSPNSLVQAVRFLMALGMFLPAGILLYRSIRWNNARFKKRIRIVCVAWLGTAAVLLMLNFASADWPENLGNFLHYALLILCSPIGCTQYWMLSVFLWACLLYASFLKREQK